jgi:hypothetical protein
MIFLILSVKKRGDIDHVYLKILYKMELCGKEIRNFKTIHKEILRYLHMGLKS